MGLKTTNYEVKKLGMTLPEAYAIVQELTVYGKKGTATLAVQTSRENAEKVLTGEMRALEEVEIDFEVLRDSNDRSTAYAAAKADETKPFYGWENDIVEKDIVENDIVTEATE